MDAAIVEQGGKLLPLANSSSSDTGKLPPLVNSGSGETGKLLALPAPGPEKTGKLPLLVAPGPQETAETSQVTTPEPADLAPSLEDDPLYALAITGMQHGQWPVAAKALPELEAHYPDSPEVRELQHLLALRLSAEETWSPGAGQPFSFLRARLIPALLIGNIVLYSLLGVAWLVATLTHVSL